MYEKCYIAQVSKSLAICLRRCVLEVKKRGVFDHMYYENIISKYASFNPNVIELDCSLFRWSSSS